MLSLYVAHRQDPAFGAASSQDRWVNTLHQVPGILSPDDAAATADAYVTRPVSGSK